MDEEEFWALIEEMSPEEQEEFLYDFGYGEANALPGMFNEGGVAPELEGTTYDLGTYNMLPPELNKQGETVPWGLDQQTQAFNLMQDMADMTADPMMAVYGGPGAFDPSAFAPVQTPIGRPIFQAGQQRLQNAAQSGNGYEAFIAQAMLGDENHAPMSPSEAVASLWDFLSEPDEALDEDLLNRKRTLRNSLPAMAQDPKEAALNGPVDYENIDFADRSTRGRAFNEQALLDYAGGLAEGLAKDMPIGYTDPNTGLNYVGVQESPSEMTQKFHELGLPTPFENYTDENWMAQAGGGLVPEDIQARQAAEEQAAAEYETASQGYDTAREQEEALNELWGSFMSEGQKQDQLRANAENWEPQATGPADNPYNLDADEMLRARSRAGEQLVDLRQAGEGAPTLGRTIPSASKGWATSQGSRDREDEIARLDAGHQAEYEAAYDAWDKANRDRVLQESYEQEARDEHTRNLPEAFNEEDSPWVRVKDGQVEPIYDFGLSEDDNAYLGTIFDNLINTVGYAKTGKPGERTKTRRMNRGDLESGRMRTENARQGRRNAQIRQTRTQQTRIGSELGRAAALAQAEVLQGAGRTPMNDTLMQRAMARNVLLPRY